MDLTTKLQTLLNKIEQSDEATITAVAVLLESMRRKLSVRCQDLAMQQNSVFLASAAGDKATLRNYAEFSQFESVRSWAAEAAQARRSTPR